MTTKTSHEKEALRRAAEVLGGQAALASVLGFEDRRNVWPWFNTNRRVPAEHCPLIEKATRERGHAITCEELRPDVAWDVLRMQAGEACHETGQQVDTGLRRRSTDHPKAAAR